VTFVATTKEDYDKYMRILEVTVQTCATMLAIVFALASQKMTLGLQVWVTVALVFLTVTILFSGAGIVLAKKTEPSALKGLALTSFFMLIGVILLMLVVVLFTIWS
jgi:hypothetical protein